MPLNPENLGPVRSIPDPALAERKRQMQIAQLEAKIGSAKEHMALISSELWSEVVAFLQKLERAALYALAAQSDDREIGRLQGEIRVYRGLQREQKEMANALAAYDAQLQRLKQKS